MKFFYNKTRISRIFTQRDGYTIITIIPNNQDEILIYASKSKQSHILEGLAKFYID